MADDEAPELRDFRDFDLDVPPTTEPLEGLPAEAPPPPPAEVPADRIYVVSLAPGSLVTKLNVKRPDGSRIEIGARSVFASEADLAFIKAGARSTGVALRIGIST